MTHSLHREGSLESLEKEYVLFIYPARGFNYKGSAPKVRHMVELLYQAGPVNMIPTSLRRNMYSGVTNEEILDSITVDGTRVYSVFNDREKLKKALILLKEADEGISIMVSGVIDRVREIAAELGIDPHMVNLSLGIHGRTDRLAPADIREFTTMCGHGVVSPFLVKDMIRRVKTERSASGTGACSSPSPAPAGSTTPVRSAELLREKAPLYTVDRW